MKFTIDEYCFLKVAVVMLHEKIEGLYQLMDERDKRNGVKRLPEDTKTILAQRNMALNVLKKLNEEVV